MTSLSDDTLDRCYTEMDFSSASGSSGSDGSTDSVGNTSPQNPRIAPSIRWCFTLHNYSEDDINDIIAVGSDGSKFSIFSEELGKSGEKPHLQGYIEFKKKVRPLGMFKNKTIHWEKAKGNREQNITYIKKENGNYWLDGKLIKALKLITPDMFYGWQESIIKIIDSEPNDRDIIWVYGEKGCNGKSCFGKYICAKYNAIIVSGKASDMKFGIVNRIKTKGYAPEIVIIDIPRSQENHISYAGIEEIKNGCFFSNKYESDMCLFNPPHIIIFSNHECPEEKFSEDRLIKFEV